MRFLKPQAIALAACFLLTACASSPKPGPALQKPLPAEYAVRCPAPAPAPSGREVDPVAVALKDLYDLYGICAGRMVDLLDYLDGGQQ